MKIEYIDQDYLAGINRDENILYIGTTFLKMPIGVQKFILLHELGHKYYDSSNEFLADQFALQNYLGSEHKSLKTAFDAISLVPNTPTNLKRKEVAFNQIFKTDCHLFNNSKACNMLYNYTDNFLGLCPLKEPERSECQQEKAQKRDDRRNVRQDKRDDRRNARQDKRDARVEDRENNRDYWNAILGLMANQTGSTTSGQNDNSKGKSQDVQQSFFKNADGTTNKKNTAIVVTSVIAIIVILIFIFK